MTNASIRLYAGLYFDASASLARNQKLSRSRNWKRQGKAGEVVKETVAFLALQSVSAFLSLSLACSGWTNQNHKCQVSRNHRGGQLDKIHHIHSYSTIHIVSYKPSSKIETRRMLFNESVTTVCSKELLPRRSPHTWHEQADTMRRWHKYQTHHQSISLN